MAKFIIIEGPDCSGKSTVVNRIKNLLHWDSKSLHHQKGDQFSRYLREYALAENVVFDRSHFSEMVYSQIWRGGNPFSKTEEEILNSITNDKAIIILTCPSFSTLRKRYQERDYEQQIKLEELKESRELFCKALAKASNTIYYGASTYEELNRLLGRVKNEVLCDSD